LSVPTLQKEKIFNNLSIPCFMANFFQRIFGKREEKIITLKLKEVFSYITTEKEKAKSNDEKTIVEIFSQIKQHKIAAKRAIETLEAAKLQNQNIPTKEKQFMGGNREAYIRKANSFLDSIHTGYPHFERMKEFCRQFDENLEVFGKGSFKPYRILQHFFEHEASNISKEISHIDKEAAKIKKIISSSKVHALEETLHLVLMAAKKKRIKKSTKEKIRK